MKINKVALSEVDTSKLSVRGGYAGKWTLTAEGEFVLSSAFGGLVDGDSLLIVRSPIQENGELRLPAEYKRTA